MKGTWAMLFKCLKGRWLLFIFNLLITYRTSVTTCILSIGAVPYIVAMYVESKIPLAGRTAIGIVALSPAFLSTFFVHYFAHPYVMRLWHKIGTKGEDKEFRSERLTFWATTEYNEFKMKDVKTRPDTALKPFVSFRLGKDDDFYLHEEAVIRDILDQAKVPRPRPEDKK